MDKQQKNIALGIAIIGLLAVLYFVAIKPSDMKYDPTPDDPLQLTKAKVQAVVMNMPGVRGMGIQANTDGSLYIHISVADQKTVNEVKRYLTRTGQAREPIVIEIQDQVVPQKMTVTQ